MNVQPSILPFHSFAHEDDDQRNLTRRERKQQRKKGPMAQRPDSKPSYKPLTPKSEAQADYFAYLRDATQVFAIGPAGTGKTYIPARIAAQELKAGRIEKIYIARPTVSHARHKQGFLPGKLEMKLAPWLVPLLDAIKDEVTGRTLDVWLTEKKVEFLSFEHLRGRTLRDCFVILDEAQNCTFGDLKLFLTRKGENSTYVVTGDTDQVDIPDSGLKIIIEMIYDQELSPEIVEFDEADCVRSEDAREWVTAFAKVSH